MLFNYVAGLLIFRLLDTLSHWHRTRNYLLRVYWLRLTVTLQLLESFLDLLLRRRCLLFLFSFLFWLGHLILTKFEYACGGVLNVVGVPVVVVLGVLNLLVGSDRFVVVI